MKVGRGGGENCKLTNTRMGKRGESIRVELNGSFVICCLLVQSLLGDEMSKGIKMSADGNCCC